MGSDNALIQYEASETLVAMVALTDSGDHLKFNSADSLWSDKGGYSPDVKPNGVLYGGAIIPAVSGSNDVVDVAEVEVNLNGVQTTVAADTDVAVTRGTAPNVYKIHSITVNAAGAIAVVEGTGSTAFSETRAAAGGPPLIPVDSVEIGQVRTTVEAAGVILDSEIKQDPNVHCEMADYPTYNIDYARVSNNVLGKAGATFTAALSLIHTGPVAKKVFAQYCKPAFADVPKASDFVPAEQTHSLTSTPYYGGVSGSSSSSLGQASFKAIFKDGVTDAFLKEKNSKLWFKFKPDRLKTPYSLTQGKVGIARTFPAAGDITATVTISAESASLEVTS